MVFGAQQLRYGFGCGRRGRGRYRRVVGHRRGRQSVFRLQTLSGIQHLRRAPEPRVRRRRLLAGIRHVPVPVVPEEVSPSCKRIRALPTHSFFFSFYIFLVVVHSGARIITIFDREGYATVKLRVRFPKSSTIRRCRVYETIYQQ